MSIIFYVGEDLENFLEKPLKSIAKKAEKIELMEIKGLNKLKFRERNIFDGHDDHGYDHNDVGDADNSTIVVVFETPFFFVVNCWLLLQELSSSLSLSSSSSSLLT